MRKDIRKVTGFSEKTIVRCFVVETLMIAIYFFGYFNGIFPALSEIFGTTFLETVYQITCGLFFFASVLYLWGRFIGLYSRRFIFGTLGLFEGAAMLCMFLN